jgi:hypothetical protein
MTGEGIWICTPVFSVRVDVDPDTFRITKAAPLVRRFVGQDLLNLLNWANKKFPGKVTVERKGQSIDALLMASLME